MKECVSETNLQYTGYREGVVGRTEVHDNMMDEIPEAGVNPALAVTG